MVHPTNSKGSAIDSPPYDLICVGFGPASLSIAVALRDQRVNARVLFLERQTEFAWHCGMLLPDTRMQISFMKDMATFRNPRSQFTFLSYLHANNRLVPFTNLGTFYPLREEFNDYLKWCASHFDDFVQYGEEVVSVSPPETASGAIKTWNVSSRSVLTGEVSTFAAKNVIIAIGGVGKIPAQFPQRLYNNRVLHSSSYAIHTPRLLPGRDAPYKIAVVGAGQSAVEIYTDLQGRYPNCKTTLFVRQSALRPSDDSPFVNEIFDPDRVDPFYALPADVRKTQIREDKATNYSVVRLELIEHVYNVMYRQRLRNPDQRTWAHRIMTNQEVQSVVERPSGKVDLKLKDSRGGSGANEVETTDGFDLVIFGTGYMRNAHRKLLKDAEPLFEGDCVVDRKYRVQFKEGAVARDTGIWLQGCCEATHGLSDSLLSILAVRGGQMVDAIFGEQADLQSATKLQARAQL
ncbi:L-lysine 6-monooxygenase (NADPH-requiring)-domain-containing protein [Sphaerosporella brunnea]|uniref:L-ornithine N(5)-monooxygenase [NAD(P)H] n=1 Tax=Sphaerosporella brunnea TaxID=1250544 RepID=A0A5J5EVU6_9PEZI|nr:L-lysine 6-monooxygenase (NADPH-requiring)-domain-containing protein [Sphaerosporella brunnea]